MVFRGLLLGCALVTAGEAACIQGQGACPWALDSADERDTLSLLQVQPAKEVAPAKGAAEVQPAKEVAAAKGAAEAAALANRNNTAQAAAAEHAQAAAKDPAYLGWVNAQMAEIPVKPEIKGPIKTSLYAGLALEQQVQQGLILEFGVNEGATIKCISAERPDSTVYGFDSFEGLPDTWREGYNKGFFDHAGKMPDVPANVQLVKGWFENTLPGFLEEHLGPVAFLHVDSDMYSSAKTVFDALALRIVPGTVIVFDELVNYPEYREHELLAFYEFLQDHDHSFDWVSVMCPVDLDPLQSVKTLVRDHFLKCQGVAVRITS